MRFWITLLVFATFSMAKEMVWEPMDKALAAAQKDKLPLFVEYYADWCVPCQVMDANVFTNQEVQQKIKNNFHAVRLNVDSKEIISCEGKKVSINKCYSEILRLQGIPSYVILDSNGMSLLSLSGAMGTLGMLRFLDKILYEGFTNSEK